jgi:hypothetical protein
MKFSALMVVLVISGCATSKVPGGDDDNTQLPDSGVRRFDSGVLPPDGGLVRFDSSVPQPDSGITPADSGVTPDASTGVCSPPAGSSCDTSPQCGCTGGQNCSITNFTSGATSCVAPGTTNDFANCTGNGVGQCKVGSTCVDGVCSPYCESTANCPGAHRECQQVSGSTGAAVPGFKVCTQFCDPTAPTSSASPYMGCGPAVNCFPDPAGVSSCFGPTTAAGTQDQYCDTGFGTDGDSSLCAPGYACVGDTLFGFTCTKFCHIGASCGAGLTCTAFSTPQYAGTTQIGYCN